MTFSTDSLGFQEGYIMVKSVAGSIIALLVGSAIFGIPPVLLGIFFNKLFGLDMSSVALVICSIVSAWPPAGYVTALIVPTHPQAHAGILAGMTVVSAVRVAGYSFRGQVGFSFLWDSAHVSFHLGWWLVPGKTGR